MSVTAVRGKDWVFSAFWVACGESGAPKCAVNIPVTCLFKDSKPFKTMWSDETGVVKRIMLEDVSLDREMHERGYRGTTSRTLRALRKVLIEYSSNKGYQQAQEDVGQKPYICNVFYLDGQIEKMQLHTLDTLLREDTWGRQVMIIQGYVPTVSIQTGNYSHAPQVRSLVNSGNNDAADNFTRAIAKYAERAYLVGADAMMENSQRGPNAKAISLKVMNMQCQFALDPHDDVIFLYSDYTAVEIDNGRKEVEDYMQKEKNGRQVSAAQSVSRELLTLLHHAEKRGSTLEASFGHFDVAGNGFIDTDLLIDGLARLGIGVTYPVGEAVLEIIGGIGSSFVSMSEFAQFLERPPDIQVFDRAPSRDKGSPGTSSRPASNRPGRMETGGDLASGSVMSKQSARGAAGVSAPLSSLSHLSHPSSVLSASPVKRARTTAAAKASAASATSNKKEQVLQQLLPPMKDSAFDSDFMNLAASQLYDWQSLDVVDGAAAMNSKKAKREQKQAAEEAKDRSLELPLPLSAYATTGAGSSRASGNNDNGAVRGLPKWAAKRNHRALQQLTTAQTRAQQKQRAASMSTSQSLKELPSLYQDSLTETSLSGAFLDGDAVNHSSTGRTVSSRGSSRGGVRSSEGTRARSRSGSPLKSSPARGAAKVAPLSLQGIVQSMNAEDLAQEKDELLHVDHGVIMTYRVLDGIAKQADLRRTHEETDSLRYRSILEVRERNFSKANGGTSDKGGAHAESKTMEQNRPASPSLAASAAAEALAAELEAVNLALTSSFTLVIIPDLFMTLETLQVAFESILSKYPYAQLVLVGLPGMPNTVWPSNWILNADLHARSIAKLLQHLVTSRRLAGTPPSELATSFPHHAPLFFMGLGHSSYCMSRFVTQFLPALPEVHVRTRAVCLVNGLLRYNKRFKQICKDLRDSMQTASAIEVNELITSLHFFDDHLAQVGRDNCLEKFWSTRRGLQMDRSDAAASAGMEFFGVLEQLKGILLSPEDFDGAQMLLTNIPVLVVQSTEDVFVDPKNAALFRPEQLPPERTLVSDISDALDPGAVHVSWLKAGHEVVQERTPFLLGFVSQLAQICGIRPVNAPVVEKKVVPDDDDDIFDVLDLANRDDMNVAPVVRSPGGSVRIMATLKEQEEQAKRDAEAAKELLHQQLEAERERAFQAKEEARAVAAAQLVEAERLLALQAIQAEEERIAMKARKDADKLNKAKNALDNKSRDLKLSREHQMEVLRQREQDEKDRKNESREILKMTKEDRRSQYAAEYVIECQIAETSKRLAKARAEELAVYRRDEAIKRVEENMARLRAERIEERRQRAQQLVENINREELTLAGEANGGYGMPADRSAVQLVIESSNRIMHDLLECRQRTIDALTRQQMVQEKTELFRKQLATVDNDERRLRRAIRLIEINPSIVGVEMNAESQLDELRRSLAAKQETLEELTALATQRELQLEAANRCAQGLKMATQERDKLMQERVDELHQFETNLANELSAMKMEKEKQIILRDRLRIQVMGHQKRVDTVSKELSRAKALKGDKMIDTDVWAEGVMQRCVRKDLMHHLKDEIVKAEKLRDAVLVQLGECRITIFNLMEKMAQVKRDLSKITGVTRILFRTYRKFNSVSIGQIMDNLRERQARAENVERRREKESDIEKQFASAGSNSLVDRVRLKESDIRSKEERQFVGLDLVLHPEAYMHISVVEAEQMQFDEDYHCSLSKTDLERIIKLPEQISLALPFLHTVQEVHTHKLINTFMRDKSEKYFQNRDYMAGNTGLSGVESVVSGHDDLSRTTFDDMSFMVAKGIDSATARSAEIMHEILVRESLRNRLRAIGAGEELTEDEKKWLVMDHVLSPHVYDTNEPEALPPRLRTVDNTLSTIVTKKGASTATAKNGKKGRGEKEPVEYLRSRFAQGEDVFGYDWKCPFTRKQLLEIRKRPLDQLVTAEEIYARKQLDKYYVDDKESTLGHSTLKMAERMVSKVSTLIANLDKAGDMELKLLKEAEENEPDDASTVKSGRSFSSNPVSSHRPSPHPASEAPKNHFGKEITEISAGDAIARVWGSWNEVHPASAGKESQTSYFQLSTFDASRDHPASFADRPADLVDEDLSDEETDDAVLGQPAVLNTHDENDLYTSLLGEVRQEHKTRAVQKNDPTSHVHITESITELAGSDPRRLRGKVVLMLQDEPMNLLEVKGTSLQARQSRSHYFTLPNRDSVRALDITVSIVFKGDFAGKGYKLGRLAAGLFRLPDEKQTHGARGAGRSHASMASAGTAAPGIPEPVGYAPYHLQSPNLPDSMGRIVIVHKPRIRPLLPGTFQIVVGAASNTKYSIEVSCTVAKTALPIVDEAVTKARQLQSRLPTCIMEIEGIEESIRLAERKNLVCEKMIQEAELESERAQKGMRLITKQLERDDEELTLMEDERRDLQRELGIFEIEYAQWANTFATRSREKDDIRDGIKMMYQFKRDKLNEKAECKKMLEQYRRDLPACLVILRNTTEAVHVAMSLNTIVQGVTEEATAATAGDFGGIQVSTPAEDVRRNLKQYGYKTLSLEEQQWLVLDQALNPQKYEWLREQEEKDRVERENLGKKPKEKKFNPAIEEYRLTKVEIEYIMDTPFSMLSRREVIVRKLLTKYHDDKAMLQKSIAAVGYSFDPHLAERTRAKNPKGYSPEESAWATVDRVLHPEIWNFYVNRQDNFLDRHEKDADDANSKQHNHKKLKDRNKASKNASETASQQHRNHTNGLTSTNDSVTMGSSIATGSLVTGVAAPGTGAGPDGGGIGSGAASGPTSSQGNRPRAVTEEDMAEVAAHLQQSGGLMQNRNSRRGAAGGAPVGSRGASRGGARGPWLCPFDREAILRIWRTPRHFLKTDDEREVLKLLQKYNGSYTSYMDAITQAKRRQGHFVKEGSHIQWEKLGKLVSKDVDFRARQILREIDRATFTKNEWISSDVLHANDQKFPTRVLRMHLEEALDVLLTEQIKDRERAEKFRVDSSDSEDEEDAAILLALEEQDDVSLDDSDGGGGDGEILNKVRKRAMKREKRKRKLKKVSDEAEVMKMKKVLARKKTGVALAEAILQNQLGVSGCLSCRSKRCKWKPSVDVEVCMGRKRVLDEELERVRADRNSIIFESDVCLSVQLGGNRVFKRQDLVDELMYEIRELGQRIDLNNIDRELHDAYATRKEYFESKYLHGYSLLLWTNNARMALEMRQSRLCALSVSKEVVDDILDWMLEGWYFGERESQFKVLGYVPTIKATGKVRAGQDQISSVAQVVAKMKTRANNRRNNIATAQSTQGLMIEKAWEVEVGAQQKLESLKVARDGNEHEHMLNETETTLKFGIFMMTLMYFRAMTFLKREQKSWAGEGDEIGVRNKKKTDKVMTDERLRMLDEENRAAARKKKVDIVLARCKVGEARRAEREAAERREAILRMQAVVRRQRLETESISVIQKVYRGHLGRKAAKRWALKRAELGAMNALLNSTAIAIQRVFRGYEGRLFTVQKRTEMAQFIALMRVQESQQDEEIYWQTHPWSRFKRDRKEWIAQRLEKYRGGGALGGSRLTADEQAELEGRTLAEIKRQIEGLGEDDDEDGGDDDGVDGDTTTAGGYFDTSAPADGRSVVDET